MALPLARGGSCTFVDRLLDATAGRLSPLVVINELLIDMLRPDLTPDATGRIPVAFQSSFFLRRLTERIDRENRRAADGGRLPIYAGGMTRLDTAKTQQAPATPSHDRLDQRRPESDRCRLPPSPARHAHHGESTAVYAPCDSE
ncbi:MAG: hypothetical protein ACLPSH_19510 [Vulcanimicrobiaceae bacterium]